MISMPAAARDGLPEEELLISCYYIIVAPEHLEESSLSLLLFAALILINPLQEVTSGGHAHTKL